MNVIEIHNLTKKFGDFTANDNISLSVEKGEIKAIVGENGAGKTTLMNMLYGLLKPTTGKILIDSKEVNFKSPLDAIHAGLGMAHQHFKLVPSLTIYENIVLGIEKKYRLKVGNRGIRIPLIDQKLERDSVQEVIDKYKFDLDASAKIEDISVGQQQRVEILKMLYREVDILILDEPTAVLTPQEVDELIISLKELKRQGKTIIIITHKLREVMELSDTISVIKRGKVVGHLETAKTNEAEISRLMVGREVVFRQNQDHVDHSNSKVAYRVENISTTNSVGKEVLKDISFQIREGEILGVAGVEGNGQGELSKVLTGLMNSTKGKVHLYDKEITNHWPRSLRDDGISIIPEDRYVQGLCRDMTIADNIIAGYHYDDDVTKFSLLRTKNIKEKRDELVDKYDIRISDIEGNVSQLSGGNAQKIIIAREFDADPEVIIANQPTRGVDIGSIEYIHGKILEYRENKKAILLISSELSEVMSLSDRIIVMYKGEIIGEMDARDCTKEEIGLLMAGVK